MKPLDIDGNELRIGDDVEIVGKKKPNIKSTGNYKKGDRDIVMGIVTARDLNGVRRLGVVLSRCPFMTALEPDNLRLIPRDKKADKNISWKSEVRA